MQKRPFLHLLPVLAAAAAAKRQCSPWALPRLATRTERVLMVLFILVEKKAHFFTSKWTTAWHHGVRDALLDTHLQALDSPIPVEEEWPSSKTDI